MKILFVHQNFPAQFKHLAPELVNLGHDVRVLRFGVNRPRAFDQIEEHHCQTKTAVNTCTHPWITDIESKVIRGEACYREAKKLKNNGYYPDQIICHPGWGESLFLKEVWPNAMLSMYCEFYYSGSGLDVGFDPEFKVDTVDEACRMRVKNLNNDMHSESIDSAICPTNWQASTFPEGIRSKMSIIHDGIDTSVAVPNPSTKLTLKNGTVISANDQIITFVARNLEPYRGYHTFMRALPKILESQPHARVMIVGEDRGGYGAAPNPSRYGRGNTWKKIFFDEIKNALSEEMRSRIHFLGRIPYDKLISLFQISSVHVYLTYPFVLSWSLLEAMSAECAIIASRTGPLLEVIEHEENGLYVDFFNHEELSSAVVELLDNSKMSKYLGKNARLSILSQYDLEKICLPKQVKWIESLKDRT